MKTVSIIIPVYNTEEFVEQCINSVINQTYQDIEIIIINDHSSDNSLNIITKLQKADNRIRLFNFDNRQGVGAARNFGVKQAQGDFIYFLDSDDYLPENTINYLITHIGTFDFIRGRMKTTHFSTSFAIIFNGVFNPKLFTDNKFNLLKNNSAVNFLFKKEFIISNALSFSEELEIFTDINFMVPALSLVQTVPYINEALYFKRNRHDPIKNPALGQYSQDKQILNFLKMYEFQTNNKHNKLAKYFLDTQFLNFYRSTIISYFENQNNIDEFYDLLKKVVPYVNKSLLKEYDWVLKSEIECIANKRKNNYIRLIKRHNFFRSLKKGIKSRKNFNIFLHENIFSKLPIDKDLIFFESFGGKGYSDSPKYIYEYIASHFPNKKTVWSIDEKTNIPGDSKQVKKFSLKYYYYLAKSKYWVTNARMPNNIFKRDECVYIQTWHGTPLKRLAADLDNVYMPGTNAATYKRNFSNETAKWDYLVSPNAYSSEIFKRAFWFNGTMLEYGYPRNDILYNHNTDKYINNLKQRLNLPADKKVILYAPTWRDDEYYSVGQYQFSLKLDLAKMQKELGDEYIVILRMHYLIASILDISDYPSFVYDFSSYNDISKLYLISDILITDYSSVFFDYANLRRPIIFYTYDLDKYRDQLRGFYLDIENDLPGPLLETTHEIIYAVKNIDELNREYQDRYDTFYERFCKWDDGDAAKNIVEEVIIE